jgi:RHS repeat-associated protein
MNVVRFLSRLGMEAMRFVGSRNSREAWCRVMAVSLMLLFAGASTAETVTYYYTNQQGTPLATADASGNILTTSDYRPYGSQVLGAPAGGPGYTGHVNDPDSGLVYMQARYYDPVVGRFLGVDQVGASPGNPLTFGRYAYAADNPVANVDADGRCVDGLTCDSMAKSIATHPDAFKSWGPYAAGAAGIMALPTVVLAGAAALPEAGSTVAASGDGAADIAAGAARQTAMDAESAGATRGAASAVVTEEGEVFTGLSTRAGGPGVATNPLVQEALDAVPEAMRSPFHGCCAEINAFSKTLNAGSKLRGATAAAAKVGSDANEIMEACSSCKAVAGYLEVMTISP